MKEKLIERTKPIPAPYGKEKWWITVQEIENILVLNVYHGKILISRYCINKKTHEFKILKNGVWYSRKIADAVELDGWYSTEEIKKRFRMSKEDRKKIIDAFEKDVPKWAKEPFEIIDRVETEKRRRERERAEIRRMDKVNEMMRKVPETPGDIKEWINQKEINGEDYCLKDKESGKWSCSACGRSFQKAKYKGKPQNDDIVICPKCGKELRYKTRKRKIDIWTHIALIQQIDEEMSVVRYFDVEIYCGGGKKQIGIDESVRVMIKKEDSENRSMHYYYNQDVRGAVWIEEGAENDRTYFDDKTNRSNREIKSGYLYDGGIEEALKGTEYETWTRVFEMMAAEGTEANYHRLLECNNRNMISLVELLLKGKFRKLLKETSESITYWGGEYAGKLSTTGTCIEETFKIKDRQKINRIREKDGGEFMLEWMRWSDTLNKKISDEVLSWLMVNSLSISEMSCILGKMTLEQAMNYIRRQQKESYKGKSSRQVLSQYIDYLKMCEELHKDVTDKMIYKPRELKRRHNECVSALERMHAELRAEEYSKKYKEAESVLAEIKEKFEYTGEEFFIKVPDKIVDIVAEGNYLHHCAGSTDRYFDRIKQHETYICFMRKAEEPDIPFYTIEVEPGGTIRQHRGMFDEEPELEKVKPFLKEWQKVLKKRITKEDKQLAKVSALKRQQNIEELEEKGNTRVLNGLMEDFMEAM